MLKMSSLALYREVEGGFADVSL